MHRREVDGIELEVGLAVETLVASLGVVHDVDGEVLVIPGTAILAADLLADLVRVRPGASTYRLVVGEECAESAEGAHAVDVAGVGEVPLPDVEFIEQGVQLADKVSRS